jgi:proline iminopeptidase
MGRDLSIKVFMLSKFSCAALVLFAFGCTKEATQAEIAGCREGCRTELVCALNQSEFGACGDACAKKIEEASDPCREALAAFGTCAAGLECKNLEVGTCDVQNKAVVDSCSGFTIDGVISVRPDAGYSVPDGGAGGYPDAQVNNGPQDAGFADPSTLLEGVENLDGLKTYVKMLGTLSSTMPPALFLHTGPSLSHEYLLPFMKEFEEGRLLIFYDMRATGRSSFGTGGDTSTVTIDQHALDIHRVLDFVDSYADTSKVDILGHGYGAAVGLLFAARFPEKVSRLIFTSPFAATNQYYVDSVGESGRRLTSPERQQIMSITSRPECLQNDSQCFLQVWSIYGPKTMCPQNREKFTELSFRYGSFRAWIYVSNQLRDSNFDFTPQMAQITAPTTIISGPCDTIPEESALTYAREIPGAVHHTLNDSGAFPFVETSTAYYRLVKSALIYP